MLKICVKRRANIYLKFFGAISLVFFYFAFLFRESLHAFEVNKGGNIFKEADLKISPKRTRLQIVDKTANGAKTHHGYGELHEIEIEISTLNPVYEYSEELHAATEKDLQQRKALLWEICVRENITGLYPPNAWEFFISPGHSLAWCSVFKAASSTWMYYFNILGGYDIRYLQRTKSSPLELARKRFPRPKESELFEALASSLSFLTVRDPFERLLSAYRDKLEGNRNKYYKVLGKLIVKQFRQTQAFINQNALHSSTKSSSIHLKKHNSGGPTFKEFLLFLIENFDNGKHFDEHWAPIYSFCTPCSINYTLIIKMETLQRDTEYIIRQAGLEPLLLGKLPRNRMRKITNQSSHSTKSLLKKYFSKIDYNTLHKVANIYRLDFELFGYDLSKYYDMIENEREQRKASENSRSTASTPKIFTTITTTYPTTVVSLS